MGLEQFTTALEKFGNIVQTANGANALKSSGNSLCDLTWKISSRDPESMFDDFCSLPIDTAIKWLFWVRDPRAGNGERQTFRVLLQVLIARRELMNEKIPIDKVLSAIEKYGRWDDLIYVISNIAEAKDDKYNDIIEYGIEIIKKQLVQDITAHGENKSVSLLAKWLPSENTSSKTTCKMATWLRTKLELSPKTYRKTLSKLRSYLKVVEVQMCDKKWNEIDYKAVPSQANLKYMGAFLRNDEVRRRAYLEALEKGETKINASVVFPHDIIHKYFTDEGWDYKLKEQDSALEGMWKALPQYEMKNTLVMRDGSGSMQSAIGGSSCTAMEVADGLAIYSAEHNEGFLKNKFITFSRKPRFVDISSGKSLRDKIKIARNACDVENTNIAAAFELVLSIAVKESLTQEDLPEQILVLSDMEFDRGAENWNETLFESIANKFNSAGYDMPKLIFWNLSCKASAFPMVKNNLGLTLISGYSLHLFTMITSGELDPEKAILAAIEKYADILL